MSLGIFESKLITVAKHTCKAKISNRHKYLICKYGSTQAKAKSEQSRVFFY